MGKNISFEFVNQFTPMYIPTLYMRMKSNINYTTADILDFLHDNNPDLDGKNITTGNVIMWKLLDLINFKNADGKIKNFELTELGSVLQELYESQPSLFYDVSHLLMTTAYERNPTPMNGRFWVYTKGCEHIYTKGKENLSTKELTGLLLAEAGDAFPEHSPKFPSRGVESIYPWLQAIEPPFLVKNGNKTSSKRREMCSPQLLHLALDHVYYLNSVSYGSPMALTPAVIQKVCLICLIDENAFFPLLNQAKMMFKGISVDTGQYNTSLVLQHPPTWIDIPRGGPDSELLNEEEEE